MLSPKKMLHRKVFKGKIKGVASAGAGLQFGFFGLKACEPCRMTARQIEAARRCIARAMKREGKFWCRVFPHMPVSAKSSDSRMGGGKGNIDRYVAKVYPGTMIFELAGVTAEVAKKAFGLAAEKLSIKSKYIEKEEGVYVEY
ncbi:50S ribosomal protein L16 [Alphaproteobacteria bacterium endosymbiont of Tiliacea citrago]|uniref:50S ribosomal protein L16 n=1 Tax=Alphaproteobacteria bacterium endosymbiont of Tiliacea citrago TaxID=3077944 RepID=UPI00313A9144